MAVQAHGSAPRLGFGVDRRMARRHQKAVAARRIIGHGGGMSERALEKDGLAAVRAALLADGLLKGDGIHPRDVVVRGQELLVIFQWQQDPAMYAFPVLLDDLSASPWTGEPVDSLEEWAGELVWLPDEELMSGYMAVATRQLGDGWIELRQPTQHEDDDDDQFDVAEVKDPALPALLNEAGLDVAEPVRLTAEGRMLCWHAMYLNSGSFVPVGSVATCWDGATTARLVHLETAPSLPATAVLELVRYAVSVAAASGASTLVSAIPVPRGEILGFRAAGDGSLRLQTHLLEHDRAAMAALREEERREQQKSPAGSTGSRLADHVRQQRATRGVTGDYRTCTLLQPIDEGDDGEAPASDPPTGSTHNG